MPRVSRGPNAILFDGDETKVDPQALDDELETLREGTRRQFESSWVFIDATSSATITHDLREIPWSVDVIRSFSSDGSAPADANGDVTVVKTTEDFTVTTTLTEKAYYKVRAF